MKYITPRHMIGFNTELQKEAGRFGGALRSIGRFARSGTAKGLGMLSRELKGSYGKQLALGTGLGAAGGAAIADQTNRAAVYGGR
jgi:hypothetical protein